MKTKGATAFDKVSHKLFEAATDRRNFWRDTGVICVHCEKPMEFAYCEDRLYAIRCDCPKIALVKHCNPEKAARVANGEKV